MSGDNEMMSLINQARSQARNEGLKKFFTKNLKTIGTILFVVAIIGGGFLSYGSYEKSQSEKYSKILHQSLMDQQAGKLDKARESLEEIYNSSAPEGVRAIASLRYGAFLLNEDKPKEAIEVYETVNRCTSCDGYVKDLAGLLLVRLWLSDVSDVKEEDLAKKINLVERRSSVLKYHIVEQKAFFELKNDNLAAAYNAFDAISKSKEVSADLKKRADSGLKIVLSKGYEPKNS